MSPNPESEWLERVALPSVFHKEGQFAIKVKGDCLSERPTFPKVSNGDIAIVRTIDPSNLKEGELVVVFTKSIGAFIKEFVEMKDGMASLLQYKPKALIGIPEEEITCICKVDSVAQDGSHIAINDANL